MQTSFPKDKIKIVLLEGISDAAVDIFKQQGYTHITCYKGALSGTELRSAIENAHILGIRSKTQLHADMLHEASKLLAVGCYCIGTNQVDLAKASQLGIPVFNAPYSNTRSVAELVLSNMIQLIRQIPEKNKKAHNGIWNKESTNSFELRGKILGIVGYGHIGSQLSIMAESMGMDVYYYDVNSKLPLGNAKPIHSLEDLVSSCDIISIHVPENNSTIQLFNASIIQRMKKNSILINYARGNVVDLNALNDSLRSKHLLGAAIDVFPEEPKNNGDAFTCVLQQAENVILTPHIGGSTEEAQANIGVDVSNKLLSFINSGNTMGSHALPELYLPTQSGTRRILHVHNNVPGVLSSINHIVSTHNLNIVGQFLTTNSNIGYVVLDVKTDIDSIDDLHADLEKVKGTIRTRVLY